MGQFCSGGNSGNEEEREADGTKVEADRSRSDGSIDEISFKNREARWGHLLDRIMIVFLGPCHLSFSLSLRHSLLLF